MSNNFELLGLDPKWDAYKPKFAEMSTTISYRWSLQALIKQFFERSRNFVFRYVKYQDDRKIPK